MLSNINLENELIILSLETVDKLFKLEGGSDAVTLYLFYHKQSKIQQTNQSYSLSSFCKKGLHWGDDKFQKSKNILKDLGLVEDVRVVGKDGKINGRYIKLNYMKSQKAQPQPPETTPLEFPTGGNKEPNALSSLSINALSSLKENGNDYFEDLEVNAKFKQFLEYRKEIKKELKSISINGQVKRVNDWIKAGHNVITIIDNTINNGWQGLFDPKDKIASKPKGPLSHINPDTVTQEEFDIVFKDTSNYNELRILIGKPKFDRFRSAHNSNIKNFM